MLNQNLSFFNFLIKIELINRAGILEESNDFSKENL